MHVLSRLHEAHAQARLPQLRRQPCPPSDPPRRQAGEEPALGRPRAPGPALQAAQV